MNDPMDDAMTDVVPRDPARPAIPALRALGDQFELVAAQAIVASRRRRPVPWPSILAPALAVLVLVMVLSVRLAPTADALVVRAADQTAAVPTAGFVMTTRVEPADGSAAVTISSTGVYDRTTGRLQTTVDLGRVLGGAGGTGSGLAGTVETVEDGSIIYLHSDVFERALPQHTAWVKVDTSRLAITSPIGAAASLDGTATDPGGLLDALRGIGPDTHVVERVDLDGVPTTHYRGTVDIERAAAAAPAADRARLRAAFARLGLDASVVSIPMDVWVDDDGDVRRVAADVSSGGATATVTIDYRDLGRPDPLAIPAPDEVTDITSLVDQAAQGPLGGIAPR